MTQVEVYKFLKNHPNKWFTSNELIKKIKVSRPSLNTSVRKLKFYKEIKVGNKKIKRYNYQAVKYKK